MRPIIWFAPVGLLCVYAGYVGYRMGQPLSEGDAIVHWAQHYVDTVPSGAVTDCAARPDARAHVWMVLTCGEPAVIYDIAPGGGLAGQNAPAAAIDAQT